MFTPQRYATRDEMNRLAARLNLRNEENMHDWPLEVSDYARLSEFCELYRSLPADDDLRFVLMELILFSLEEWLNVMPPVAQSREPFEARIEALLRRDFPFHLHTLNYWRLPGEKDEANVFSPTPMVRRVWADGFRDEYQQWLDDG